MEQSMTQRERCTGCGDEEGLYASGWCERCLAEEQREKAVADAFEDDPHAPVEGSIAYAAWLNRALEAYDRQEEMR